MPWHWFLLSICGFAASLGKFTSEFIDEPPALVFPLQQLREHGRLLTVILLGILLLTAYLKRKTWRRTLVPRPLIFLIAVQILIFLKNVLGGGDLSFAVQAALVFGGVILMHVYGPSRWLKDEASLWHGFFSIAMVGLIFAAVNLYQIKIDPYPVTFVQGWFLGTTGNPHIAAILMAGVLPCILFFLFNESKKTWLERMFWMIFLLVICFGIFKTASRTGMVMSGAGSLLFFRQKMMKLWKWVFVVGIIGLVWFYFANPGKKFWSSELFSLTLNKLGGGENTRAGVWGYQWRGFMNNLFFGAPLNGDRLRFGESSWLGVANGLGLIGLIPMLMLGFAVIGQMMRLDKLSRKNPANYYSCSVVVSGLAALLVGSFAEAYLLGNLTFSVFVFIQYLLLGHYLLENEARTRLPAVKAESRMNIVSR